MTYLTAGAACDIPVTGALSAHTASSPAGRIRVVHAWVTFSKPNPTQNFWTQPNPQKYSTDPTQPIIDTWYGILGYTENFIQQLLYTSQISSQSIKVIIQLQYSLTDSRVFHDVKNITQSSLHPTQPNPWMDPTHDQLWVG